MLTDDKAARNQGAGVKEETRHWAPLGNWECRLFGAGCDSQPMSRAENERSFFLVLDARLEVDSHLL